MYATVVSVEGDDVMLEVAPGVNVRYMRRAIMNVVPDAPGDTGFADEDESMDGSGPAGQPRAGARPTPPKTGPPLPDHGAPPADGLTGMRIEGQARSGSPKQ